MGVMKLISYIKYLFRFLFLQTVLTSFSIYYFDKFLIGDYFEGYLIIRDNLLEDRDRFYPFITNDFIKTDIYIALFIFIFLIILYSTNFYTYVNELTYSLKKKFFDEFFPIYLLWTSCMFVFFYVLRFSILARSYLILYTFLVPLILILFRNSELLSSLLGRSVSGESFITFNLDKDSLYRKLRIMTFRKNIGDYELSDFKNPNEIINTIDEINKNTKMNLLIFNLGKVKTLPPELEEYLIKINKKILLISKDRVEFNNKFIYRIEKLDGSFLTYFNNDIQYGSKYIVKRVLDILVSLTVITLLSPLYVFLYLFILIKDGRPVVIKQNRVGLHGKQFSMYKFRTMKNNSHSLRDELNDLNERKGPIFKIENDPRILQGANFIRDFSFDELPQFFNVIRGDMSVVGPRPLFDDDTKSFDTNYMRRLNVMPGITGLLQINDRNATEFSTWYKYDILYIENWSIALDLKIIFKTPLALLKSKTKGV
jgi:lipopolysaccharide/colanic/teichoic acid biosynthesis glycosyltransferase